MIISNVKHVGFDISLHELKSFIEEMEKEGMNSIQFSVDKESENDDVYGFILTAMDDIKYQ